MKTETQSHNFKVGDIVMFKISKKEWVDLFKENNIPENKLSDDTHIGEGITIRDCKEFVANYKKNSPDKYEEKFNIVKQIVFSPYGFCINNIIHQGVEHLNRNPDLSIEDARAYMTRMTGISLEILNEYSSGLIDINDIDDNLFLPIVAPNPDECDATDAS